MVGCGDYYCIYVVCVCGFGFGYFFKGYIRVFFVKILFSVMCFGVISVRG